RADAADDRARQRSLSAHRRHGTMTLQPAADWARVKAVFDEALTVNLDDRPAYVARACAADVELRRQVEALLASHDQADSFLEMPAGTLIGEPSVTRDALLGHLVADYRIERHLGAGGMGDVYLARDENL